MLRNYIITAYRILFRNKVFSLINIFGLSIALTSVLVIFLFISHELSFVNTIPILTIFIGLLATMEMMILKGSFCSFRPGIAI